MTGIGGEVRPYEVVLGLPPGSTLDQAREAYHLIEHECHQAEQAGGDAAARAATRLAAASFALTRLEAHRGYRAASPAVDLAGADRARLGCLTPVVAVAALILYWNWPKPPEVVAAPPPAAVQPEVVEPVQTTAAVTPPVAVEVPSPPSEPVTVIPDSPEPSQTMDSGPPQSVDQAVPEETDATAVPVDSPGLPDAPTPTAPPAVVAAAPADPPNEPVPVAVEAPVPTVRAPRINKPSPSAGMAQKVTPVIEKTPPAARVAAPAVPQVSERRTEYFTVGDSKDDVLRVMGQPDALDSMFWRYGASMVTFSGDRVEEWTNSGGNLKAKLEVRPGRNRGYFTVGDSKDEVLRVMGQPDGFDSMFWRYGASMVTFSGDRVEEWTNSGGNLKAKLITGSGVSKGYFTVGDSKDAVLRVMGQPDGFDSMFWRYGASMVTFSGDRVEEWTNSDGNLKARLEVRPGRNRGYFAVGDSKDEVLRVMGQPDGFDSMFWRYGSSMVTFSDDHVEEWTNSGGNLKVKGGAP